MCREEFCLKHRFTDAHSCKIKSKSKKNNGRRSGNTSNAMANAWSSFASTATSKNMTNNKKTQSSNIKSTSFQKNVSGNSNTQKNIEVNGYSPTASNTSSSHSSPSRIISQPSSNPIKCPFGCINNFESTDALMRHINRLHPETNGKKGQGITGKGKGVKGKGTGNKNNDQESCCVF